MQGMALTSAECGCIVRSEADGGYLVVSDFYLGSRAIVVGEEAGALRLDLLAPVTALSLDFGGTRRARPTGPRSTRHYAYRLAHELRWQRQTTMPRVSRHSFPCATGSDEGRRIIQRRRFLGRLR
jgi:hypothetical protein